MAKAGETQDRCTQYALDVVSGKITAGEYVRLACQRHLDDIEKSKAAPYKYYFDVEKSEEIINFARAFSRMTVNLSTSHRWTNTMTGTHRKTG